MQENSISDTTLTQRVPIVLPGMDCRGSEQSVSNCPDFDLGLDTEICTHANDVHLHCFSGSNPGATPGPPSLQLQTLPLRG